LIAKKLPMRRLQISIPMRVSLVGILVAGCMLAVVAQSGRRARTPEPAPTPTPEATPGPTPNAKPTPAFMFIVGVDKYGNFSRVPLYTYSGVVRSCAARLDDSRSVKSEISTHDMSRADAIRQAKAEKEAYIVWLQLRPNNFSGQTGVNDDPNNVYIQYSVFAPVTGEQVTSGNTFPEAYRNARVRLPTSTTSGDYYLNQAAQGAAERILDHFNLRPNPLPLLVKPTL
jgi:hypothetical protein